MPFFTTLPNGFDCTRVVACCSCPRRFVFGVGKDLLEHLEHEVFTVLWLDNRNRVLAFEELFRGTIDGASVHPPEVVKSALIHNAAACIIAHNHPSGVSTPSQADRTVTDKLKEALSLIDVRVLDHIIVGDECTSFAEQGLL